MLVVCLESSLLCEWFHWMCISYYWFKYLWILKSFGCWRPFLGAWTMGTAWSTLLIVTITWLQLTHLRSCSFSNDCNLWLSSWDKGKTFSKYWRNLMLDKGGSNPKFTMNKQLPTAFKRLSEWMCHYLPQQSRLPRSYTSRMIVSSLPHYSVWGIPQETMACC